MERAKDVLDHVRSFHKRLADYYARIERRVDKERLRLLLDYLSRHERRLADTLWRIEEGASRGVLDTWFQFTPDTARLGAIKSATLSPDMSCDEVVAISLELDDKVIQLYRDVASSAQCPEVRELFENLLKLEESEEHEVTRNALFLRDY